jgi:RNA polymerase sigma-70 factor, ECF subfamily
LEKEFLNLVNQNQGIILKICRMYCNDREDSEDLFQEILLALWKSYPRFDGRSKETTWMYKVGLNVAITSFRKRKKRPEIDRMNSTHYNITISDERRLDIDYDDELQRAINVLTKFDKALLMLYLEEKSYKDIAEIMALSESNVGVKVNRIKKKLQEILTPSL